jgi:hypothetical protein
VQEAEVVLREMEMASWIRIYQLCPSLMCIQEGNLVADLITPRIAGNVPSASNRVTRRRGRHGANGIKTERRFPCLEVMRQLRLTIVVLLAR